MPLLGPLVEEGGLLVFLKKETNRLASTKHASLSPSIAVLPFLLSLDGLIYGGNCYLGRFFTIILLFNPVPFVYWLGSWESKMSIGNGSREPIISLLKCSASHLGTQSHRLHMTIPRPPSPIRGGKSLKRAALDGLKTWKENKSRATLFWFGRKQALAIKKGKSMVGTSLVDSAAKELLISIRDEASCVSLQKKRACSFPSSLNYPLCILFVLLEQLA
ncbi:hypothetical protein BKA57DRAFT_140664 [Linnemannia elongata]|nr:hypothetical protein BKA57DRAFT_140664 [Linnemannia elongata]